MKASIHIRPVKGNSERHNLRKKEYDYVYQDLTKNNENYVNRSITEIKADIDTRWKNNFTRKRKEGSTPIREGVVLIKPETTMQDLKKMCEEYKNKFGIKAEQIHIHRDEGKSREELNLHAHIVFNWTDEKGKIIRLGKLDMIEMQNITSKVLEMERGESKEETNKRHIESKIYKGRKEYEDRKKALEINNEKIKEEIKKLGENITKLKLQENDVFLKNFGIEENIKTLIEKKKDLKEAEENLKNKIENLENSNSNLQEEFNAKIQRLNQQTNQERRRLEEELEEAKKEKENEINELKKQHEEDLNKLKEKLKEELENFKKLEKTEDRHLEKAWEIVKEISEAKINYCNSFGDPNEMIKFQNSIVKLMESMKENYNTDLGLENEKELLKNLQEDNPQNQNQTQNKTQRTNLRL